MSDGLSVFLTQAAFGSAPAESLSKNLHRSSSIHLNEASDWRRHRRSVGLLWVLTVRLPTPLNSNSLHLTEEGLRSLRTANVFNDK